MRISDEMREYLRIQISRIDPSAQVFLFGSRADDKKRGGDIDILILSKGRFSRQHLRQVRVELQERFGEQRIDIVNFTFDDEKPFKTLILREAVPV